MATCLNRLNLQLPNYAKEMQGRLFVMFVDNVWRTFIFMEVVVSGFLFGLLRRSPLPSVSKEERKEKQRKETFFRLPFFI